MKFPSVRLMTKKERRTLPEREQLAVAAFERHLYLRAEQTDHEPVEIDPETGHPTTFLTGPRMQRCLRESSSRLTGEKFALESIHTLERLGLIEDTGQVKKPRLPPAEIARREGFYGSSPETGGRSAQPSQHRSYWWRVFRVLALPRLILSPSTGTAWAVDAFGRSRHVPAFLSALLRSQPLVKPSKRRSRFAPGSVQWTFHYSGPP